MKVFISWSGEPSKKIAEEIKKWIKYVIQSVEPFVSSEDIEKGSRWSGDIAKQLENTNFGLLCVTKDNYKAPWLLFEAGALSKAMDESFVVPLLFGLEPSDLSGSPLLQFQTVHFAKKEDFKKLIQTINNKIDKPIDNLDEIFEKWYPDLEVAISNLSIIPEDADEADGLNENINTSPALEEILSLSRENQKLLINTDNSYAEKLNNILSQIEQRTDKLDNARERSRRNKKIHPMLLEELLYGGREEFSNNHSYFKYRFLMALSLFKEDFPWIYDLGKEFIDILGSNIPARQKRQHIKYFFYMLEEAPHLMRNFGYGGNDEMIFYELPRILSKFVDRFELDMKSVDNEHNVRT